MAPALWPRVSRILWLACLLPLAPAGVAAGKALRGPAARPPQAAARRGPRREPGLRSWRRAPCAPLSSSEPPGGSQPAGRREVPSSLPSPLTPEVASPLEGLPRPPRRRPYPGNRARWPAHPSRRSGSSQPLGAGGGERNGETGNVPGRLSRHSPQGGPPSCPQSGRLCRRTLPSPESLSTLFILASGNMRF